MTQRGLFITGTDTGVGKTYIAASIARVGRQAGLRVGVYKPVASGCDPARPEQQDAWLLWDAAGRPRTLLDVCPQSFAAPLAPHLAARAEGREVDEQLMIDGVKVWRDCDLLLVEGAGGLMTPVSDDLYVADLAAAWGWPLVVVAANRLGVINQTLQTLIVAETFREGLTVSGVILNDLEPEISDASVVWADTSRTSNWQELSRRCVPPLLARVRFGDADELKPIDWLQLASRPRQ